MKHRLVLLGLMSSLLGVLVIAGCSRPDTVSAVLTASPSEGVAPLLVEFHVDRSTCRSSGAGSFSLDFGDGTNSILSDDFGMAIPHVYGPVGTYVARLTVIASDGRTAMSTASIVATGGAVPEGSAVGTRAYDFAAPTTDGREVTLHELRGSVVLIEFWGSWCIPCRTSMPHINALWEAYHDQGLVVLAVSTDTRAEDAVEYLATNGFSGLTCLWEPGGKSTRIKLLFQVDWIPRSIIVDRTGMVRYNGHPMDLEAAFVETLLAGPAPESADGAKMGISPDSRQASAERQPTRDETLTTGRE